MRLLLSIILFSLFTFGKAQVNAPALRCIACAANGDLTLTWIVPPDPGSQFFSYEIFYSSTGATYNSVGTINTYSVNTFTHAGANGTAASRYYYVRTRSGPGGSNVSQNSDTIRSVYLNLGGAGTGTATMAYNNLHTPKLPSTASTFTVLREYPVPAWSTIKTTSATTATDIISRCNVFYSYQIQLADASGCISTSNISGANFKDQTAPEATSNNLLDTVSINSSGQTVLGWNPSASPDCAAYVIYQFITGSWQIIDTVVGINNTIYTSTNNPGATNSATYCIASLDSCGNIGVQSSPPHSTLFLNKTYDICNRSVVLDWNTYSNMKMGVSLYKVYCSVNSSPYQLIGSTTGLNFEHTGLIPGQTYCYIVRAYNTPGTMSSTSNRCCLVATAPAASAYVYLQSASVDLDQTVLVSLYTDTFTPCKGFNILRSDDAVNFTQVGFVPYNGSSGLSFKDAGVSTSLQNYYYKAQIVDSCGNTRYTSNIGKTILLHVENDKDIFFNNKLSWSDYTSWAGGVAGYYIFRIVNEVLQTTPIDFVPFGVTTYTDNVEDIVSESGKVGYLVSAVEGFGNPYNIIGSASSNTGEAYVEATVFVPNAFTPKGENRIWMPVAQYVEKSDYHVMVFNRWGVKVFETTSDTEGWNGSGMEDNTYVYLIQYKNARGEFVELKGTVTMVR